MKKRFTFTGKFVSGRSFTATVEALNFSNAVSKIEYLYPHIRSLLTVTTQPV